MMSTPSPKSFRQLDNPSHRPGSSLKTIQFIRNPNPAWSAPHQALSASCSDDALAVGKRRAVEDGKESTSIRAKVNPGQRSMTGSVAPEIQQSVEEPESARVWGGWKARGKSRSTPTTYKL